MCLRSHHLHCQLASLVTIRMMFSFLLYKLFPDIQAKATAKEVAAQSCQILRPDEPIFGVIVCADEPDRYVVRVFCGKRRFEPEYPRMPPWRECLIFAVMKDKFSVEQITNGEYQPVIR